MTWTDPTPSRTLLEGSYKRSFLHLAFAEGHIRLAPGEEQDELMNSILTDMRRARKRREVLERLLLFDEVVLYGPYDCFDVSELEDQGLQLTSVEEASWGKLHRDRNDVTEPMAYLSPGMIDRIRFLKPLILPFVRRRWKHVDSKSFDAALQRLGMAETREYIQGRLPARQFLESVATAEGDRSGLHDAIERFYQQHPDALQTAVSTLQKRLFQETLVGHVMPGLDIVYAMDVLDSSIELRAPVASTCVPRAPHPSPLLEREGRYNDTEHQVLRLMLKNIEYFPSASNLTEVMALRKDRRIVDFRSVIRHWATALEEGDDTSLVKLTDELRRASRGLKRLRTTKRIAGWSVFVTAPLSLVQPLAVPIAVLSMAAAAYTEHREHEYRWLMLGQ